MPDPTPMRSTRSPGRRFFCSWSRVMGIDAGPMLPRVGNVAGTRVGSSPTDFTNESEWTLDTWWVMYRSMSFQLQSGRASRQAAWTRSSPFFRRALASVNMPSTLPTHRSWNWVAARVMPPTSRWPLGWASAGPRTAAAAPEPSVRLANSAMKSLRLTPSPRRRFTVVTWTSSASSPSMMSAYLIWPESIIVPARLMALTNPRHALAMSKLMADDGSPSPWCRRTATDGSRWGRVTEVLMRSPISLASTPASASARLPASMAAVSKLWSGPQLRRSSTPATRWRSPRGSLRRLSAGARRSSSSSEVVTRDASVLATERRATLRCVVVALPSNESP